MILDTVFEQLTRQVIEEWVLVIDFYASREAGSENKLVLVTRSNGKFLHDQIVKPRV